jgi:hypothetical protein
MLSLTNAINVHEDRFFLFLSLGPGHIMAFSKGGLLEVEEANYEVLGCSEY